MKVVFKEETKFKYLGVKNVVTFDKGKSYKFNLVLSEATIYGCALRKNEKGWFVCLPSVKTETGYFTFVKMWITDALTEKIYNDVINNNVFSGELKNVNVEECVISSKYLKNGVVKFDLIVNGVTFKSLTCREVKDINSELVDTKKMAILPPSKKNEKGKYFPFYRLNLSEEDLSEIIEAVR